MYPIYPKTYPIPIFGNPETPSFPVFSQLGLTDGRNPISATIVNLKARNLRHFRLPASIKISPLDKLGVTGSSPVSPTRKNTGFLIKSPVFLYPIKLVEIELVSDSFAIWSVKNLISGYWKRG